MKKIVIQVIRKTSLYYPLRNWMIRMRQIAELAKWEREGRQIPPPDLSHIVKQKVLREYAKKYGLRVLVETGTLLGDMVEAMKMDFNQIYSIELCEQLYERAKERFKGIRHIELIYGDSSIELRSIMGKLEQPALFWLDGHYSGGITSKGEKDTPIYEELNHIINFPDRYIGHVIIIDDAHLFGTNPSYPSIEELSEFIKSKRSNLDIVVQDDIIRITPK